MSVFVSWNDRSSFYSCPLSFWTALEVSRETLRHPLGFRVVLRVPRRQGLYNVTSGKSLTPQQPESVPHTLHNCLTHRDSVPFRITLLGMRTEMLAR